MSQSPCPLNRAYPGTRSFSKARTSPTKKASKTQKSCAVGIPELLSMPYTLHSVMKALFSSVGLMQPL